MTYRYAQFDQSGAVLGWYDNNSGRYAALPPTAQAVPAGYVEASDDLWAVHLSDLAVKSWSVVNGNLVHSAQGT